MPGRNPSLPYAVKAEAAAWLARLRALDCDQQDEMGFRAWLSADPRHVAAFNLISDTWEIAGGVTAAEPPAPRSAAPEPAVPASPRRRLVLATVAVAAIAGLGGSIQWLRTAPTYYATAKGEQRRIALVDGSTLMLDTDTEVRVLYSEDQREVDLLAGRAHFEVAKDAARPFRVRAGGREVVALGTAFDVSRRDDRVAVLLIEGKIAVRPTSAAKSERPAFPRPGEELMFERDRPVRHEAMDMARAGAWREGRAIFDDQPLASAVAEMNRYNRRPLIVTDPALAATRISGTYDTGDAEAFARTVAHLLSADVVATPEAIRISPGETFSHQGS